MTNNSVIGNKLDKDLAVFRARFWRCHRLLHFIACRVLDGPERADEAVEKCWLTASRNPRRFEYEGAFRSWLVRVLMDEALAILQEKRHTQNGGASAESIPGEVLRRHDAYQAEKRIQVEKQSPIRRIQMKASQYTTSVAVIIVLAAFFIAGISVKSSQVHAQSTRNRDSRVERGFDIAPVPLNLEGKNRDLVGLGSYFVNAVGGCNDCHDAGPQTQFAPGGNPYFGQPSKIDPATYLGGGRDFGPLLPTPGSPHIVSRNLTPDKTGLPEGGRPFSEFLQILRTGVDLDRLHPPCSATESTNCLPPPFDGNLLQIMPWPSYQNLSEHDIRAIYEYLSAVPCIEGPPPPSVLHNDCGKP